MNKHAITGTVSLPAQPKGEHGITRDRRGRCLLLTCALLFGLAANTAALASDDIDIDRASWSSDRNQLSVRGDHAPDNATVTILYPGNRVVLGTTQADSDGDWSFRLPGADPVPCRVRAETGGSADERSVRRAPDDCSNDGGNPPVNEPPVAQNDEYNTQQDTTLSVDAPGVLSNDNDQDGDLMSAIVMAGVSDGTLTLNPDGSFTYTPDAGFTGADSFTYTANDAGGASNVATVNIGVAAAGEVSINSTSANGTPTEPVDEQLQTFDNNYTLLAINDLGMHCGDLDTRVSSILPPFNVLHAQVVERGINGLPRVMNELEVELFYSAASNPNDPALGKSVPDQALSSVVNTEVYKTNFWDIASQAYAPFYPAVFVDENGNPSITATAQSVGILDLFYDPIDPAQNVDIGLPVPDVERLYLEDGYLHAGQQAMPGMNTPYASNDRQAFHEHIGTLPFFINFPFGYTAELNLFEAPGVPIAAFDDFGRENPYPLVRVEAHVQGAPVASLDTVMPISGEASCQSCHADIDDGGNGAGTKNLTTITSSLDDPAHGLVPNEISIEWASDNNILRLHDQEHGTDLLSAQPVVCQTCHYTPALDLAQLGPLGPENDGELQLNNMRLSSTANGRDQFKHKSMSNVMHSHHATVTGKNGGALFPDMPPAIDGGNRRDPAVTRQILGETCYLCHPGERTDCMRGAMANGGLVCQDCHGQMANVGNDFTRGVSPQTPGAFELAADFYTNRNTPRVPWANEPGCGSCHTGYATDNLAGTAGTLVNPSDTLGNFDGIRLLAAFRTDDPKATPIVPTNKAFAENVVTEGEAAGNPKLYRVSTGHGGVMCEGCHGSTHAEWPNANPNANDNVTANQLQGHTGTIMECDTCHTDVDNLTPNGRLSSLEKGPHGMHAVGDTEFARHNHKEELSGSDKDGCRACHGQNGEGTVLSRVADDRVLECKETTELCPNGTDEPLVLQKGHAVGCSECHDNELSGNHD